MRYPVLFMASLASSAVVAAPALAQRCSLRDIVTRQCSNVSAVPEIDVSSGLLALAAIGAATLLVWEVRRRRA